jgi:hypothetical protein
MADKTFRWFAGVDWGSAKHQACLLDEAGTVVGERAFAHGGAGLAALCDWLVSIAGEAGRVAVAIEVPHGPVVDALLDRGFAVHAINPKQLERLRDRVSLAGAKDDRRDARVAAGGLRTDPHLFRPVEAGDPAVIALREWSHLAEDRRCSRSLATSSALPSRTAGEFDRFPGPAQFFPSLRQDGWHDFPPIYPAMITTECSTPSPRIGAGLLLLRNLSSSSASRRFACFTWRCLMCP